MEFHRYHSFLAMSIQRGTSRKKTCRIVAHFNSFLCYFEMFFGCDFSRETRMTFRFIVLVSCKFGLRVIHCIYNSITSHRQQNRCMWNKIALHLHRCHRFSRKMCLFSTVDTSIGVACTIEHSITNKRIQLQYNRNLWKICRVAYSKMSINWSLNIFDYYWAIQMRFNRIKTKTGLICDVFVHVRIFVAIFRYQLLACVREFTRPRRTYKVSQAHMAEPHAFVSQSH